LPVGDRGLWLTRRAVRKETGPAGTATGLFVATPVLGDEDPFVMGDEDPFVSRPKTLALVGEATVNNPLSIGDGLTGVGELTVTSKALASLTGLTGLVAGGGGGGDFL